MRLSEAIKRVEKYRDSIVSHTPTAEAMSVLVDAAKTRADQTKVTEQALAPIFAGRSTMPSGLVETVERLIQSRADTAFLVGVNYGRTSERERIERESK